MMLVYTLLLVVGYPWALDARDAWKRRRLVRRECRYLDLELEYEFGHPFEHE